MRAAQRVWAPLLGLSFAGAATFALYGFTVDDALISARYATHIAQGHGHRFNTLGPVTDGVTPLVWPYLLAPFASDPNGALEAARWLGVIAWLGASVVLAKHLSRIVGPRPSLGHLSLLVAYGSPAVAAWASAGMETAFALCLVTIATIVGDSRRRWTSSALLGIACTLRPELLPFACTLALGCAWLDTPGSDEAVRRRVRALLVHAVAALGPFVLIVLVRWMVFGAPGPLALRAKPSDISHGLRYAMATFLIAGPPLAVMAPWAWRKLSAWPRWLLAGWAVHTASCIAVGGDWMPLSRLFVPVLPCLAIVFAHLARTSHPASTAARAILCLAGQVFVLSTVGASARRVFRDRAVLIEQLRGRVRPSDVVASLDIGWVGAAHQGTVVDLAGVTDPVVAGLPGGHTSKRIPPEMLASRGVTHMLLLLPSASPLPPSEAWENCALSRAVEARLCRAEQVRSSFQLGGVVRSTDSLQYLVLERSSEQGRRVTRHGHAVARETHVEHGVVGPRAQQGRNGEGAE
jgi:hypothetical protein